MVVKDSIESLGRPSAHRSREGMVIRANGGQLRAACWAGEERKASRPRGRCLLKVLQRGKNWQVTRHRDGRGSEDHTCLEILSGREDLAASPTPLDLARPLSN